MTNHVVDNSLKNLGKTVLWQYDRAVRLLSLIKHMQVLFHCAVEQFWNWWIEKVLSIETCGDFGNSVWGIFLGVPNPTIVDETGTERFVAPSVYRKVLKGAFYHMKSDSSYESMLGYLEIVFGIDGSDNVTKWIANVSEYGWTSNVDELNFSYEPNRDYKSGFVFWYDTDGDNIGNNWKCTRDISKGENTSFDNIRPYLEKTQEKPTDSKSGSSILFKLIDPEGIVRKIVSANNDSLSINLEYEFGDTLITASASRRRKCGVFITDHGDMSISYGKSKYYDLMHRDQKYLFEQKLEEVCPFPLGIKTNEPAETWIFGFDGQQPREEDEYHKDTAYYTGDVVWRIDEEGRAFHWKFNEDVSVQQNTSFDAIRRVVEKTNDGDPFISGISDTEPFDMPSPLRGSEYYSEEELANLVISDVKAINTSVMALTIDGNSSFSALPDSIPTEFLLSGGSFSSTITLDGFVWPIEYYKWIDAFSRCISLGSGWLQLASSYISEESKQRMRNLLSARGFTNAEISYLLNYEILYRPIKKISYENGTMQPDVNYRDKCIVKVGEKYWYIKKGGTFDGTVFSGELIEPDKATLLEKNQ